MVRERSPPATRGRRAVHRLSQPQGRTRRRRVLERAPTPRRHVASTHESHEDVDGAVARRAAHHRPQVRARPGHTQQVASRGDGRPTPGFRPVADDADAVNSASASVVGDGPQLSRAARGITLGALPMSLFAGGHVYFVQRLHERLGVDPLVVHTTYQFSQARGKRQRPRTRSVAFGRRRVLRSRGRQVRGDATGGSTPGGARLHRRGGKSSRRRRVVPPGDSKPLRRGARHRSRAHPAEDHVRVRQVLGRRPARMRHTGRRRQTAVRRVPAGPHHEHSQPRARGSRLARVVLPE